MRTIIAGMWRFLLGLLLVLPVFGAHAQTQESRTQES